MRIFGLMVLLALPMFGQAVKPCADPEYRQFDFWVGKWRVETPDGKLAGINEISKVLEGCVIHEKWSGEGGMKGESFNIYDKSRSLWHQTWVDTNGLLLQADGKLTDGAMVLSGTRKNPRGTTIIDRITWSKLENGRQRQHWQSSNDAGKTWSDVFVGFTSRIRTISSGWRGRCRRGRGRR